MIGNLAQMFGSLSASCYPPVRRPHLCQGLLLADYGDKVRLQPCKCFRWLMVQMYVKGIPSQLSKITKGILMPIHGF